MSLSQFTDKFKTALEIFNANKSVRSKLNFLHCINYNLLPSYFKGKKINHLPISTTIYVNTICNYRCPFCFLINEDHKGDKIFNLTLDQFTKIIDHKFNKFAARVTLGGGEPFLNKYIYDFIKILKERKRIISIYTNGSLIERQYDDLLKNQPNYLNISHYDDKFNDLAPEFKKFNSDKNKKCLTRLSKIVNRNNLKEISLIVEQAIENNFDRIIFQNYFSYKKKDIDLILYENDKNFNELKSNLIKKYGKKIKFIWPNLMSKKTKFNCNNISVNSTIDSQGNIAPCCFITPPNREVGNIFKDGEEIWNSKLMQNFRSFYGKESMMKDCEYCYFNKGINNRVL